MHNNALVALDESYLSFPAIFFSNKL